MGNIFAARSIEGTIDSDCVLSGIEYMKQLATWYEGQTTSLAFLQIGGGIAGDFPICVVPMLNQDLERDVPLWSWFGQISESALRMEDIQEHRQVRKLPGEKSMHRLQCS